LDAEGDPDVALVVAARAGVAGLAVRAEDDLVLLYAVAGVRDAGDVQLGVAVRPPGAPARDEPGGASAGDAEHYGTVNGGGHGTRECRLLAAGWRLQHAG